MLVNYDAEGQLVETLGVAYREGGVPSTVIPANLSAGMYWMQLYNLQGMPMGDA